MKKILEFYLELTKWNGAGMECGNGVNGAGMEAEWGVGPREDIEFTRKHKKNEG